MSVQVEQHERERLRDMHVWTGMVDAVTDTPLCDSCEMPFPCSTVRALDALAQAEARVKVLERERDDLAEANENAWTNVNLQADELGAERAMLHERVAVLEGVVDLLRRWHGAWLHRQAEQAALGRDTEERAFQDILDAIDEAWRQEYRAEEELAAALAALDGQQDGEK